MKEKIKFVADRCLLIGAIAVMSTAIYFNVIYYAKQREKSRLRP